MSDSRIEQLIQSSGDVLRSCALSNGAIVAANGGLETYPATAENYHFVWARDNAFQLNAAHQLRLPEAPDIKQRYLSWLMERCQGFSQSGLIIKRNAPNGVADWRYGTEYQPDQAGALLWALDETTPESDELTDKVMRKLAKGLVSQWNHTNFWKPTQDLWENRMTDPVYEEVFTYTAAACIEGLERAALRLQGSFMGYFETDEWLETASEMRRVLKEGRGPYLRKVSIKGLEDNCDNTSDASLSALMYPFSNQRSVPEASTDEQGLVEFTTSRRIKTVRAIGEELYTRPEGIIRYENDTYDGIARPGGQESVAGQWPLLTFWYAIALNRIGDHQEALNVYDTMINHLDELYKSGRLPNNLIPEQVFADDTRQGKGMLPLAWSHAMFVSATKELGII